MSNKLTTDCLAPLSFRAHAELAEKPGGGKMWGCRHIDRAEVAMHVY